jgi:hypothetical protein
MVLSVACAAAENFSGCAHLIGETKKMNDTLICYCFNYTAEEIKNDFIKNGESTIMARIINEKKNGQCHCESKNPKGR